MHMILNAHTSDVLQRGRVRKLNKIFEPACDKQPDSDVYNFRNNLKAYVVQKNFQDQVFKILYFKDTQSLLPDVGGVFCDKKTNNRHASGFK